MLEVGKEKGDMRGIGYDYDNSCPNTPTLGNDAKITFVKGKGKAKAILKASFNGPKITYVNGKDPKKEEKCKAILKASSSKSNIPFVRDKAFDTRRKRKANPKNFQFRALSSKNPPITCYYCGLIGHINMCRKRLDDWKAQQLNVLNKKSLIKKKNKNKESCLEK